MIKLGKSHMIIVSKISGKGGDTILEKEPNNESKQFEIILSQASSLDDIIKQVTEEIGIADYKFTKQELEKARGELSPMNDRVATATFSDNKNNDIITGIVNKLRKIHDVAPIAPISQTWVQELTLPDVLGRVMVADMISEGWHINVATEIQKGSQADFAVRGTLSSSNAMRRQFKAGDDYSDAPDTIGVYILGFNLPELSHRKEFVSRIVRAEYESKQYFLPDKYSDYYIELNKVDKWKKAELPEVYRELWDFCTILKTKIKDQDEVIRMNAIQTPIALDLARETKKAVAPDEFVDDALRRERGLREIQAFLNKNKAAGIAVGMEKMIITAFKANAPSEIIEAMRKQTMSKEVRKTLTQRTPLKPQYNS